jgi:hypothetical protein
MLSIFNKRQGNDDPMLAFFLRFDSLLLEMSRCKVTIPLILLVKKFLCTKLLYTTKLISSRHKLLHFAPWYSKGPSLELWICHKQKGCIAPSKNGNSVKVVDTNDTVNKHSIS